MQTIIIMVLCGIMSYYTGYLCIKLAESCRNGKGGVLPEFQEVCRRYLGKTGEYTALLAANVIVIGALAVYYVLMAKFLFGSGMAIYEIKTAAENTTLLPYVDDQKCIIKQINRTKILQGLPPLNDSAAEAELANGVDMTATFSGAWDLHKSIPLYLLVVYILTNIRDPTFFSKFSAFGTLTVFLIFITAFYKAAQWGISENVDFSNEVSPHYVTQFNFKGTAVLPGILSMAYFVHSAVTTLVKDNRNQENNARDLGIAYFLVFITYTILGLVFYLAYPGWKGCMTDMFIENFDKKEWIVPMMDVLMFIRILTVYPLLTYFIRVQNFSVFCNTDWPGYPRVMMVNFFLVALGCSCAMFYDKIGDIIRYAGSFCSMIYMFFLPCCIYMMYQKKQTGRIPIWSWILHVFLMIVGLANFIIQFTISAY
jgi:sodium-coupled neutral amino acid transporter 9